jgi:RNA-directed DNA polymerase
VIYPHKRRLKRRKGVAYARRFRCLVREYAAGRIPLEQLTASARGWANHAAHGDTLGLRRAVLSGVRLPPPIVDGTSGDSVSPGKE